MQAMRVVPPAVAVSVIVIVVPVPEPVWVWSGTEMVTGERAPPGLGLT